MIDWNDVLKLAREGAPNPPTKVQRTPEQWREQLSEEQFRVTRMAGTERPFSSEMCTLFEPGRYACICCETVLFDAATKFDSGTGWPSFSEPATPNVVAYHADTSHGMTRVEVVCNVCEAHLGHVFPDGPMVGGKRSLRYCINAVCLQKVVKASSSS